ncbi:hypothetical protein [Bordetella pseudohinzii]|uniref:hypothetical protein n=1 Tax=Bordetella pseudohinzii TaxID=1331258 RepID=UPI00069D5431|nr:hypothetical protein [Bordetella pseudohinzii]
MPLPDDQAAAVLRAVGEIEANLPSAVSNRRFLELFIPAVQATTGRIYGVKTYLRLLSQFAPARRPSTQTVQSVLDALRSSGVTSSPAPTVVHQPKPSSPRIAPAQQEGEWQRLSELMEYQRQELAMARSKEQAALQRANMADEARERALIEAAASRSELEAAHRLSQSRQETIDKLTAALELANQRAAGDNRMAMLRVDAIRQEVRDVEEKLRAAKASLARKEQELRDTQTMLDNLRIKSARLQQMLDQQPSKS